jgi:hypothetical protein
VQIPCCSDRRFDDGRFDPCPPAVEWGPWVAHIYIYGDESGKFGNSACVSMCGYVGQRDDWQALSDVWVKKLAHLGLPPIHMSQIFSSSPKAAWRQVMQAYSTEEWPSVRSGIVDEFARLISEARIYAVGAVVDAEYFRKLPGCEFKEFYQDPVFLGFYALLFSGVRRISCVDKLGSIGFVVDDDPDTASEFYDRLTQVRRMPHELCSEIKRRVDAITFARDDAYPGVQAADMLAYVARRRLLASPDAPLSVLSRGANLYNALRPGGDQRWPLIFNAALLDRMAASGPGLEK